MEDFKLLLVDSRVLPPVFERVVVAKSLLAAGKASNLSEAAKMAGISRSALYKYKDYVFLHSGTADRNVITLNISLEDRPGALSMVVNQLSSYGANILTVNQNIPMDGIAQVSVAARLNSTTLPQELVVKLRELNGVIEARILNTG